MDPGKELVKAFASEAAFEKWLATNHAKRTAIWVKYAKKSSGLKSIDWNGAVDVALCYGWIDGQGKSLDETYTLQRFTPRGSRSKWSKLNRERVARLINEGRMRPAGLAEVKRAKADGRWDAAYDPPSRATVPDDLAEALAKNTKAKAFFETLNSSNRYAILYRLQEAKRPETRARRLETFVQMLKDGKTFH